MQGTPKSRAAAHKALRQIGAATWTYKVAAPWYMRELGSQLAQTLAMLLLACIALTGLAGLNAWLGVDWPEHWSLVYVTAVITISSLIPYLWFVLLRKRWKVGTWSRKPSLAHPDAKGKLTGPARGNIVAVEHVGHPALVWQLKTPESDPLRSVTSQRFLIQLRRDTVLVDTRYVQIEGGPPDGLRTVGDPIEVSWSVEPETLGPPEWAEELGAAGYRAGQHVLRVVGTATEPVRLAFPAAHPKKRLSAPA